MADLAGHLMTNVLPSHDVIRSKNHNSGKSSWHRVQICVELSLQDILEIIMESRDLRQVWHS